MGSSFAYNAQAAVDEGSQLIIATKVTQVATDVNEGIPRIEATTTSPRAANIIRSPRGFLADAGYCSEADLTQVKHKRTLRNRTHQAQRSSECIPRGRIPKNTTRRERLARGLRSKSGLSTMPDAEAIVEPVSGQMKVRQKADNLRLRRPSRAETE